MEIGFESVNGMELATDQVQFKSLVLAAKNFWALLICCQRNSYLLLVET
jgi:hypothetical protein